MDKNKSPDNKIFDAFIPDAKNEKLNQKELDILEKNHKFYSSNDKYIKEMVSIINGESNISIRVLDWFVTNYSKKYNTVYKIKINGREDYFYVNIEYKNQLNSYSKFYFDPFCRKKKVAYSYKSQTDSKFGVKFMTSIGQLNFFQWAIRYKIIYYVNRHLDEIVNDMKETTKANREKKLSSQQNNSDEIEEESDIDEDSADPAICSSDKINNMKIGTPKKVSSCKSSSDSKIKRQQLSKSVYDIGIKKSTVPIRLDFD